MAKILYVGAEEHMEHMTREELEEDGHRVLCHPGEHKLFYKIEHENPDLVLLDDAGGFDTMLNRLQEIRNAFFSLPLILYCAYDTFREDVRSIAADFSIIKSFDTTELKKKISLALEASTYSKGTPLNQGEASELISREIAKALNYQVEPPRLMRHLSGSKSLMAEFRSKEYLKFMSEQEVHSIYSRLVGIFFDELSKAKQIGMAQIRKRSFSVDKDNGFVEKVCRVHIRYNPLKVLSFRRFLYEVHAVLQMAKELESYGFKLSEDFDKNRDRIVRSIEFPPEYHQAGVSILNFFGTVLRKKCPSDKAKIRIEQDGLKVTMIIDPLEGKPEVIEQALDEYGLLVVGQISPEAFTDDKLLIIDLKNQLRLAASQIQTQKELLEYQHDRTKEKDVTIDKLLSMVGDAIQNPSKLMIQVSPKAEVHVSQEIQLVSKVTPMIQTNLNELRKKLPEGSEEVSAIQEIQSAMQSIQTSDSRKQVKESSAMSKLKRFLENMNQDDSKFGKTIRGVRDGVGIIQEMAKYYNDIAQWCGLPQVPRPFLKGNER
jgi:DNA-binding response OmpR family regulator